MEYQIAKAKGKPMAINPQRQITEIQDAADALCQWFESQDIPCGRAVAIMSYLLGAMSVTEVDNFDAAYAKLKLAHAASVTIALSACKLSGKR
jgi:hypothetical protein